MRVFYFFGCRLVENIKALIFSTSHTLDTTALQTGDSIFQHQQQIKGTSIMLAAGEAVFLRTEAETMLAEAGYTMGSPEYTREFTRRFVPLNSAHNKLMESCYAFLSPQEHAEVAGAVDHPSFFDHYDICRDHRSRHTAALTQARSDYIAVCAACMDPRFYTEYMKHRAAAKMSHNDALEAAVMEWFTRPS